MSDCATLYTLDFVRSALPAHAARVLEVGCGDGALAAMLQHDGLQVVAIDTDDQAVAQARTRGVDARQAEWPEFPERGFDAVLFTRSLHHVGPLARSVRAAFDAVTDFGSVIVEDFAYEQASEPSIAWFRSLAAMLRRSGLLVDATPFLADLLDGTDAPAATWQAHHDHELHSATALEAALAAEAASLVKLGAAYYFRYLTPALAQRPDVAAAILDHERELAELGLIDALGRRFIASRSTTDTDAVARS